MALSGLSYSLRMAAYNSDGARVSGIASTITATLWADGTTTVLSDIAITEIGNTGVYVIPLTAAQMAAYNLCITAVSSVAGITFDPVYLDTDAGRVDVATSTRLATSGYTTPPTVNEIQSGLAKTSEIPSVSAIASEVLGTNLSGLSTAAIGSLKTLFLLQTNAKLENNQIKVYEQDGTTIHTIYHVMMNNDTGITGVYISTT